MGAKSLGLGDWLSEDRSVKQPEPTIAEVLARARKINEGWREFDEKTDRMGEKELGDREGAAEAVEGGKTVEQMELFG